MANDVNKVNIFMIAFITLIVGIVLLDVTADTTYLATDATYTGENESITLINGTAVNLANDWVTSVTTVIVQNGTNATLPATNYTVGSLNSDDVATITLLHGDYDGNTSYVTYDYQDDNYVRHAQSRMLIRLVVIFFALAILATGMWAMYKMGIFDLVAR